jgi:transposase
MTWGIPAEPSPPRAEAPSYQELLDQVESLRARIADLEKLLEESHRAGKRQAAPFSKGEPAAEPK